MYGLRSINNMFAEHAGSRSDFIIVGHPEYKHGKVRSQTGLGDGWDVKRAMRPQKQLAASRSFGTLVSELVTPEPWVPLKEKTLRKQAMQKELASTSPEGKLGRSSSTGGLHRDFDAFIEQLNTPKAEHVAGRTARTPLSFAQNKRSATVCRHFAARHDEIEDLRQQFATKPDATQKQLRESGAWRYYALQMEQDRRLKAQFERDMHRLEPNVRKRDSAATAPLASPSLGRTV
uniref:Uncharacterized protein n=1 Tax=Alexandrium catenella TaxID=2925 RepID=A0A7S1RI62_ALECA|mmetsp:Transcript_58686/g.157160  ORF Transcript_58686/g.157160 Transcript_58686/m.157160 type:complete len:233 (+) Transcript_58686:102-800(+)